VCKCIDRPFVSKINPSVLLSGIVVDIYARFDVIVST